MTEHDRALEERLKASRTVPGTQKLHCFVLISNNTVEVKSFSSRVNLELKRLHWLQAVLIPCFGTVVVIE